MSTFINPPENYNAKFIEKIKKKSDPSLNEFQKIRLIYLFLTRQLEKNAPLIEGYVKNNKLNCYGALFFAISRSPDNSIHLSTIIKSIYDRDVLYHFTTEVLSELSSIIINSPTKTLIQSIVKKG